MDKKNLQVVVLVLILVGVLVAAVSFLIGKYEKEAVPPAAPVQQIAPVKLTQPETKAEETQDLLQPGDDQFPTEKGKFLQ